jgi:hypothetical protein
MSYRLGLFFAAYLFAGFWWVALIFLAIGMRFVPDQYHNGRFLSRAQGSLHDGSSYDKHFSGEHCG